MTGTGVSKPSLSLTAFLTDGALARLCGELEALVGQPISLRDECGHRIEPADGSRAWRVVEDDLPKPDDTSFPLVVDGQTIGSITLGRGERPLEADAADRLARALRLIAATASELCTDVLELRHRVVALEVLYRLSSLLTSGASLQEVLEVTLDAALEALELDAGSIMLLPKDADGLPSGDDEAELQLVASRGLSADWLHSPLPLSHDRVFDRRIKQGEVVAVSNLADAPEVLLPERCAAEGVASFLGAGVVFQDRLEGLIRLYGRSPRTFSEQDRTLVRSLGQQAGAAINQARLLEMQAEERRIQRQLALATDIQMRMLPRRIPDVPMLDIAARCEPCYELGGDFYDLIQLGRSVGVVIGDVVGKGIGAALLMAAVRSSLRAYVDDVYDLDEVLSRVNNATCRDTKTHEFATIWYGVIDPDARTLTYGSAGHDPPLLARRGREGLEILDLRTRGLVVGVLENQQYERRTVRLHRGDVLVAYTDGLTDVTDFDGKRFGRARLRASLSHMIETHPEATAEQILDHLIWDTRRYAGLAPQRDDETLVVVRVRG
ncbi:MAG: GAF domain-containing protein [Planctomycetota bacterium]|nr:MAG: GAF domain-containing protein [Planctomycetota bacterium]